MVVSCVAPVLGGLGCSGREEIRVPAKRPQAEGRAEVRKVTSSESRHRRPLPPREEPRIRVRVARRTDESVEIGATGQRLWMTVPDSKAKGRLLTGPVRCRPVADGWSIRSNRNGRTLAFTVPKSDRIRIVARDPADPRVAYRSIGLPGLVTLVAGPEGTIDVICHLDMETYLPGVLAGELYQSWLPATHEAVAIAARSFAVCERHYWLGRRDFDVVAGERSQMWIGSTSSKRPMDAVARTRGRLLVFEGSVVPGYYSAACGGRPARAVDGISPNPVNSIRPLEGDAERVERCGCRTFGSHGSWNVTLDGSAVRDAVRTWGRRRGMGAISGIGWPFDLSVVERLDSGRPVRFALRPGPRSTPVMLTSSELQRILNSTGAGRPVRSSDFEIERRGKAMMVRGAGFGHGVGLCQYGAEAMARAGNGPRDILARYYPGADVERVWS